MGRVIFLLISVCLLFAPGADAQHNPLWMRFYPERSQIISDMFPCDNGDFALGGSAGGALVIRRVNCNGDELWSSFTNGRQGSKMLSVIETDGGDIVAGGVLDRQFFVMRIHENGNEVWRRSFGAGQCNAVLEMKNGNLVFAGQLTNPTRAYLVFADNEGRAIHSYSYQAPNEPCFWAMRETDDHIVLLGSYWGQIGLNQYEIAWMTKIDLDGRQSWSETYGNQLLPRGAWNGLVSTGDGGFAFCASPLDSTGAIHPGILRVNSIGQLVWAKNFPDVNLGTAAALVKLPDIGFLIVADSYTAPRERALALCVDTEGNEIWREVYDTPELDEYFPSFLSSVVRTDDRHIYAAGCGGSREQHVSGVGLVMSLGRMAPEPQILFWSPADTLQTVLQGDSIEFIISACNFFPGELQYRWIVADSVTGDNDSTLTVLFDSLGTTDLECVVDAGDWQSSIRWHVTTHDLFIRSHSPDTLNLTIHHGETVPFAMSVAATSGDDPSYLWTLTDWAGGRFDTLGTDSVVSHLFDHGGNYLMEGIASRGASADTVAWNIRVLSNVVAYHPDRTRLTFPQDTTVVFSVEPSEFDTGQYRYEWLVDGGWYSDSASALVGFPFLGQCLVRVVVADSAEADTIVWEVEVVERTSTPPTPPSIEGVNYPHNFRLGVYPNPFNHRTAIRYTVPNRGEVRVSAYDVSGRLVKELFRGDRYPGDYSILWQGPAAGVYLIQVEMGSGIRRVAKGVCLP